MRVFKYPDFGKSRSKAIVFDGVRLYTVDVEIGDFTNSECRYSDSVIRLREDSPDVKTEFLHEVHHLYRRLFEPIWTPSIQFEEFYENENARIEFVKTLKSTLVCKSKILKNVILGVTISALNLGRFDNVLEDFKIHEHLLKRHGVPKDRIEAIEKDKSKIYHALDLCAEHLRRSYTEFFNYMEQVYVKEAKEIARRYKTTYGFVFYPFLDAVFCIVNDLNLIEYYERCVDALRSVKSDARGIFKYALMSRIKIEIRRVKIMLDTLKNDSARRKILMGLMCSDFKIDASVIERLLGVERLKGFRDEYAFLDNGEIVTCYKTYKISGIETDNSASKGLSRLSSILRKKLTRL